jgi:pyruvate dehydrogenase E2 component (dihydrolipoamide acetyltransferase)
MPDLVMPKFGWTMLEATLVEWFVQEGSRVAIGDRVFSIETEKVEIDVESPLEGVVTRILVNPGEVVSVGSPVAEITGENDSATKSGEA